MKPVYDGMTSSILLFPQQNVAAQSLSDAEAARKYRRVYVFPDGRRIVSPLQVMPLKLSFSPKWKGT